MGWILLVLYSILALSGVNIGWQIYKLNKAEKKKEKMNNYKLEYNKDTDILRIVFPWNGERFETRFNKYGVIKLNKAGEPLMISLRDFKKNLETRNLEALQYVEHWGIDLRKLIREVNQGIYGMEHV